MLLRCWGACGPVGLLMRVPVRPGVSPRAMIRRPYRPLRRPSIRAHGPVWGAYAIRPYRGTCIRVPSGTRPNSPASADARPYRGTCIRVFGQLPCPGRGRPQTPGLSYVLIGISVRLHLAFASGFLSVCEGKGLSVRRACQYVILRISSPHEHGRNVHFTGALFAAYQRRMLPTVFPKSASRKQSFTSQLTLRRSGFSGAEGRKRKPGTR